MISNDKNIIIREYRSSDRQSMIHLLRLNTPAFFSPLEECDLEVYLDNHIGHYFVLEFNGEIAGCGGFNFSDNFKTGKISWDIFNPAYQGRGLGSLLLQYRIEKMKNSFGMKEIIVRTSQHAHGFYEKNQFLLQHVEKDYWAPGYDLYLMVLAKH